MKLLHYIGMGVGFLGAAATSLGATAQGKVFCDSDQNGVLGAGDTPLEGVCVVVTDYSGTYSNAAVTGPDGSYSLALGGSEYYVGFLDPLTLPTNSTPIYPPTGTWVFSVGDAQNLVTADFLETSPACYAVQNTAFWLKANASIRSGKGAADHSFSGSVLPDCQPAYGPGGAWTDVAHRQKLAFKGTVTQTVRAGVGQDGASFMEFQGFGILKGTAGNKNNYGEVSFFCRIEDRTYVSQPDLYYFRAYNNSNPALMLVSTDPANPLNVAPVPISTGDLQIKTGTCENPPP